MILFNHVVEITNGMAAATPTELSGLLQLGNDLGIRRISIHVDDARSVMPGERNALCRKRLAAAASRFALRRKSMVAPLESTARYK
jgi:hypothetical protein